MSSEYILGIDLGTTNTVLAYVAPNVHDYFDVKTIENPDGEELTPSVVHFEKISDNYTVGKSALNEYVVSPERTFRWIKRKMGTNETLSIEMSDGVKKFLPQEISAYILLYLKKFTEDKLDLKGKINKVVITVPAYFGDNEKQATIDAAKIAGFEECSLIEEPSAAILDFVFNKDQEKRLEEELSGNDNYFAVFDLGGGTFDISIAQVNIDGRQIKIEIVAKDGDKYLGGYDFDLELVRFVLNKASNLYLDEKEIFGEILYKFNEYINSSIEVKDESDLFMIAKLIDEAERVKMNLSSKLKDKFRIPLSENIKIFHNIEVTKEEFEECIRIYLVKIENCIDRAINQANEVTEEKIKSSKDIKTTILIGGSTRIPIIKEIVNKKFNKISINSNLDKAVARGAAIKAAIDQGIKIFDSIDFGMRTSHTYGFETNKGFECIINRGSMYPCIKTKEYVLPFVLDTKIPIIVCQEYIESDDTKKIDKIKKVNFYHPFLYTGDKLSIELKVDINGMLNLKLEDKITNEELVVNSIALDIDEIQEKANYAIKNIRI